MQNWGIQFTEVDNEIWDIDYEGYETKEEAIKDGLRMVIEGTEEGSAFRVGRIVPCEISGIDTDRVIEYAQGELYDKVGECAETYLNDITTEQEKELEEALNNVFYEWHKKHNLFPTCYIVEDEEYVSINK